MGAAALTLSGGEYAIMAPTPGLDRRLRLYACIRMYNADILDLYDRVGFGTTVVVTRYARGRRCVSGPQHPDDWAAHRRVAFWRSRRLSNIQRPRGAARAKWRGRSKRRTTRRDPQRGQRSRLSSQASGTIGRVSK